MKRRQCMGATALALVFGSGLCAVPLAAHASEEGTRNTTLALGAAAAALLLTQKNKMPGAVVGAGALYSAYRLQQDIKHRHDRARQYGYNRSTSRQFASTPTARWHRQPARSSFSSSAVHANNGLHNGWYKSSHGYRRDD